MKLQAMGDQDLMQREIEKCGLANQLAINSNLLNVNSSFDLLMKDIKANHCMKSVRIRSFSGTEDGEIIPYPSVFSSNAGKYGPEKLRIRTLFMQ